MCFYFSCLPFILFLFIPYGFIQLHCAVPQWASILLQNAFTVLFDKKRKKNDEKFELSIVCTRTGGMLFFLIVVFPSQIPINCERCFCRIVRSDFLPMCMMKNRNGWHAHSQQCNKICTVFWRSKPLLTPLPDDWCGDLSKLEYFMNCVRPEIVSYIWMFAAYADKQTDVGAISSSDARNMYVCIGCNLATWDIEIQ